MLPSSTGGPSIGGKGAYDVWPRDANADVDAVAGTTANDEFGLCPRGHFG